jgi:xylose isomerase
MDRLDLFHGQIGAMDTVSKSLLVAAQLIQDGGLAPANAARYSGWDGTLGQSILTGEIDLAGLESKVSGGEVDPTPVSGRQEDLENLVNRTIWRTS